jgi:hypothetical protein
MSARSRHSKPDLALSLTVTHHKIRARARYLCQSHFLMAIDSLRLIHLLGMPGEE